MRRIRALVPDALLNPWLHRVLVCDQIGSARDRAAGLRAPLGGTAALPFSYTPLASSPQCEVIAVRID